MRNKIQVYVSDEIERNLSNAAIKTGLTLSSFCRMASIEKAETINKNKVNTNDTNPISN